MRKTAGILGTLLTGLLFAAMLYAIAAAPGLYRALSRGPAGSVEHDAAHAHAEVMERNLSARNKGWPPKHSVYSVGVFEVRGSHSQTLPTRFSITAPHDE